MAENTGGEAEISQDASGKLEVLQAMVAGLQGIQTAQQNMNAAVFQLLQDHQAKILELEARIKALEEPTIPEPLAEPEPSAEHHGDLRLVTDGRRGN